MENLTGKKKSKINKKIVDIIELLEIFKDMTIKNMDNEIFLQRI